MRNTAWVRVAFLALIILGCTSAASPPEPTKLRAVDVGTGVDSDNAVTGAARTFDAQNIVYLSIATEGGTPATITVQWYANTKLIDTETLSVHPTGPARFAFHHLPAGGWPTGRSRAIFYLSPEDKHAVEFEVR